MPKSVNGHHMHDWVDNGHLVMSVCCRCGVILKISEEAYDMKCYVDKRAQRSQRKAIHRAIWEKDHEKDND